jgi:hypothetical protein
VVNRAKLGISLDGEQLGCHRLARGLEKTRTKCRAGELALRECGPRDAPVVVMNLMRGPSCASMPPNRRREKYIYTVSYIPTSRFNDSSAAMFETFESFPARP